MDESGFDSLHWRLTDGLPNGEKAVEALVI
jgi:hypothetical protein